MSSETCVFCQDGVAQGWVEGTDSVPRHFCTACGDCCEWAEYWWWKLRRGGALPDWHRSGETSA